MRDTLCEADHHQLATQGYVILRRVLPGSLLAELRREADKAAELARRDDPNAQRLQPITAHPELDPRPFQRYAELPALVDAARGLIGADAWIGGPDSAAILVEPRDRPWATKWHRDFGPLRSRIEPATFHRLRSDPRYFIQINCALYEDSSTWYVPGSHQRDDSSEESRLTREFPWQIGLDRADRSATQIEYDCLAYAASMPGAQRLYLDAGDLCLYRAQGFHLGCYVPYKHRATIHDDVWTPSWKASYERWRAGELLA